MDTDKWTGFYMTNAAVISNTIFINESNSQISDQDNKTTLHHSKIERFI